MRSAVHARLLLAAIRQSGAHSRQAGRRERFGCYLRACVRVQVGGRLVYFMPATPETYREEEIPTHPALAMVANM